MRATVCAAALAALAALMTGCGGDDGQDATAGSPSPTGAASSTRSPEPTAGAMGLPFCDDVWVEGRRLPVGYRGCDDGQGAVAPYTSAITCEKGGSLGTHDDRFWVVGTGRIMRATGSGIASDSAYAAARAAC